MFTPETIPPFSVENYMKYVVLDRPLLRCVVENRIGEQLPFRLLDDKAVESKGLTLTGMYATANGQEYLLQSTPDGKNIRVVQGPMSTLDELRFVIVQQEKPFTLGDYHQLVLSKKTYCCETEEGWPVTLYRTDLATDMKETSTGLHQSVLGSFLFGDHEYPFTATVEGSISKASVGTSMCPTKLVLRPLKP